MNKIKYYMVGGAVRDKLMGKVPHDYDFVVVGATEDEMKALYGESVGEGFPVYLGLVPGYEHLGKVEIAMARKEKKTGEGHTGFTCVFGSDVTLEEDLQRRDFTINSIALDCETGVFLDPYNGQRDIGNQIIRCVNPNAFVEDPLRVLRMARFAAKLGFNIHEEAMELSMRININTLTQERILGEMVKALSSQHPQSFFNILDFTGHLKSFLPELSALNGVEQVHHVEDAFQHTMMALQVATNSGLGAIEKFALLLHDLGKGTTPKEELPHHYNHDERSYELAKVVCDRLKVSNDYRRLAIWFAKNHMRLHAVDEMGNGKIIKLAEEIVKAGYNVMTIITMSECDSQGRYIVDWSRLISGVDIIKNINADDIVAKGFIGKKVGELLHQKRVIELQKQVKKIDSQQLKGDSVVEKTDTQQLKGDSVVEKTDTQQLKKEDKTLSNLSSGGQRSLTEKAYNMKEVARDADTQVVEVNSQHELNKTGEGNTNGVSRDVVPMSEQNKYVDDIQEKCLGADSTKANKGADISSLSPVNTHLEKSRAEGMLTKTSILDSRRDGTNIIGCGKTFLVKNMIEDGKIITITAECGITDWLLCGTCRMKKGVEK